MNRKFIFSLALAMSFILESGFAIASQTALAVQFSYPYSSSSYNKVYSPNNNTSSSYDNTSYNKVYSPNNNTSSSYDNTSYNKVYSPNNNTSSSYDNTSYNKVYNIYNNDKNDEYPDSYSKPAGYSKYPTIDKIYECQTGQLEGFFTSSVEFCIAANENVR
jgi:hypothetical protein